MNKGDPINASALPNPNHEPPFHVGPVDVRRFWLSLERCELTRVGGEHVLHLTLMVPDRVTGLALNIERSILLDQRVVDSRASMNWGEFVRESLRQILLHELDENIFVDGRRAFDPHTIHQVIVGVMLGEENKGP